MFRRDRILLIFVNLAFVFQIRNVVRSDNGQLRLMISQLIEAETSLPPSSFQSMQMLFPSANEDQTSMFFTTTNATQTATIIADQPAVAKKMMKQESEKESKVPNGLVATTERTKPTTKTAIYVHVGKTGGTTLNGALESNCRWLRVRTERIKCFDNLALQKDSMISNITKISLHGTVRDKFEYWNSHETENHVTTYLVTVRNPINRIVSAFNFHHPKNNGDSPKRRGTKYFYFRCFPTIEHMAKILSAHPPVTSNHLQFFEKGAYPKRLSIDAERKCAEIGRDKLHGVHSSLPITAYHMFTNYAYYGNLTYLKYPEREIWSIRTEHLWDDMNHLEQNVLSGLQEPFYHSSSQTTHGSEAYQVHSGLSPDGIKSLCCELVDEIQIYQDLLYRATNLNQTEKEEPMEIVLNQCDVQYTRNQNNDIIASIGTNDFSITNFSWSEWGGYVC